MKPPSANFDNRAIRCPETHHVTLTLAPPSSFPAHARDDTEEDFVRIMCEWMELLQANGWTRAEATGSV
jgi:hypothetical protein